MFLPTFLYNLVPEFLPRGGAAHANVDMNVISNR